MLVNEKDAKTKWCPLVRGAESHHDQNASNAGVQEGHRVPLYARCAGSACMFWRWNPTIEGRARFQAADEPTAMQEPQERPDYVPADWRWRPYELLDMDSEPAGWCEPDASVEARRMGFCGAAVRPFED
ncbi:MAG: hypothetical protein ING91_19305 [Rhodocyclaceae bacterium]|nr:hypothetical protein [Rhodocyclaceae bacterium]MCA3116382.1 hypothetical protein [Rhodocyclaceae bacterium]